MITRTIKHIFYKIIGVLNRRARLNNNWDLESSLLDMIPDGILVTNLTGTVLATNKSYHILTGYGKDQVIGKHITQIPALRIEDVGQVMPHFKSLLKGNELKDFEFKYRCIDGSVKWGEARAKISKKGIFEGEFVAVLRDITKRKQQEDKLKKMMLELERSNRELDDYTYAVSHDLKAPLRTIVSFSNFLIEDYVDELDEVGKEYMLRMKSASIRMTELIDDLLLISRVGRIETHIELVDINVLINEIIYDNRSFLEDKNGKVVVGKLPNINSQKVWIKQLFYNLINNGIKFNDSSNPTVWINCIEKEDHYLFSVKDNGIGIDEKHHDKIFKIFQRLHTSEKFQGTGAGLTICKKIIDSIGGDIKLESKVGKGTTFYITIPKEKVRPEDSESYAYIEEDQSIIQL